MKKRTRFAIWLEDLFDPEPGYGPSAYLFFAARALIWNVTSDLKAGESWPMRCFHCHRWFDRDFFWNPWGPNSGPGLCCSEECCNATKATP